MCTLHCDVIVVFVDGLLTVCLFVLLAERGTRAVEESPPKQNGSPSRPGPRNVSTA